MKKGLLCCWVILGVLLAQIPIAYAADCDTPGTVYRDTCPAEILDSSTCSECNPCAVQNTSNRCSITKIETKIIVWGNRSEQIALGIVGDGQYGCFYHCNDPSYRGVKKCWPGFNTPMVTSNSWS